VITPSPTPECLDDLAPTRRSLLGRLRDWGDERGWQEFFNTYWKLIYSVARRAGLSEEEAEDVVQETVKAVAETMPKFRYDPMRCRFKTWLQLLTRRRIVDHFRKKPPLSDAMLREEAEAVLEPELQKIWDEEFDRNVSQAALERARQHFRPEQFQVFDLYVLRGEPAAVSATVSANRRGVDDRVGAPAQQRSGPSRHQTFQHHLRQRARQAGGHWAGH
jgi:RNA polymerase sigma factor (sigma-70 family)